MFSKLGVGKKIAAGFALVLTLVVIMGGTGLNAARKATSGFDSFHALGKELSLLSQFQNSLTTLDASLKEYLIYRDDNRFSTYQTNRDQSFKLIDEAKKQVTERSRATKLETLSTQMKEYQTIADELGTFIKEEDRIISQILLPRGNDAERQIKMLFDKLALDNNVTGMVNAAGASRKYLLGR